MVPTEVHPSCLSLSLLTLFFLRLELFFCFNFVLFFSFFSSSSFCFVLFRFYFSSWWPGSMVWTSCAFSLCCPPTKPRHCAHVTTRCMSGVFHFNTRVTTFSLTTSLSLFFIILHLSMKIQTSLCLSESAVSVRIRPHCEQSSSPLFVFFFCFFSSLESSVI